MGAGSSKDRPPKRLTSQTKTNQGFKGENVNNKNKTVTSLGTNDLKHTINKHSLSQSGNNNLKESSKALSQKVTSPQNGNRTRGEKLAGFQSDSESDTEDINDVLEATRREHNERVREQNYHKTRQSDDSIYPETYAQRLQREQYKHELGIIRQKTIYRNPEEWQVEGEEKHDEDGFDVNKFKQANVGRQVQNVQDRDIFSPTDIVKSKTQTQGPDIDNFYTPVLQKQKSVPKYDMSEEALLAEIEKEYEF